MQISINTETIAVTEGENIMAVLIRNNKNIANICNGLGTCGKCKVQITHAAPEPLEAEQRKLSAGELAAGVRLACQVKVCDGMVITYKPAGDTDRKSGLLFAPQHITSQDSGLRRLVVAVEPPTLADERGDWDRLRHKIQELTQLEQVKFDLHQLQNLPVILRQQDFTVTVILWQDSVLAILPGASIKPLYGIAVDLGTTNIAVALYNLENGEQLGLAAEGNSQAAFGADVISRIQFAGSSEDNRKRLRQAAVDSINRLINTVCAAADTEPTDIYKAVVVGNTTMHHLFLGLDVSCLALSPFVAVCTTDLELDAAEAGLMLQPQAKVLMFPNVGGFVGGDTLGAVLGAGHLLGRGRQLLIDIGTNCELYLEAGQRCWVCSTAAGPAFEGAGITCGMRAQPGAIERVTITGQQVMLSVIGGGEASGICGSGLIEAVQQMRQAGIITREGKIVDPLDLEDGLSLGPGLRKRIRNGEKCREFVLHFGSNGKDVVLTQQDISQLQLAKGAICAAIRTLLDKAGLGATELDGVILAGTFAAHLNLESTVDIGLIPWLKGNKLHAAGNAAHAGAVRALLNQQDFAEFREKSRDIIHVELGGSAVFNRYFMKSMYIEACGR
ncbi:MAG: Na(+)-translocating NADH-quinone reductase subunit [Firmicutes bacterium]|nr:Na(+)-translocating NADH-quinone reductase subunit [Bacillota bacterium]